MEDADRVRPRCSPLGPKYPSTLDLILVLSASKPGEASSSLSGSSTACGGETLRREEVDTECEITRGSRGVSGSCFNGGDRLLPSFRPTNRAAALAERTGNGIGNGATRCGVNAEFSLFTLACPGLAAGDSAGVCNCVCFEGGTPIAVANRSF